MLMNHHWRTHRHLVEQLNNFGITHPDAAMGADGAHLGRIRCAMNIYVALHGIHIPQPIFAHFPSAQPQNSGQNPITVGKLCHQLRGANLTCGPAPHKRSVGWGALADFGADNMRTQRCTATVFFAAYAVCGSGY